MLPTLEAGGPDRVRTDDLLDANQALSQLSYGPDALRNPTPKNAGGLESRIDDTAPSTGTA